MKTKVIKIYEPGSVDVLKIEEVEIDKPGLNEVLIEHSNISITILARLSNTVKGLNFL